MPTTEALQLQAQQARRPSSAGASQLRNLLSDQHLSRQSTTEPSPPAIVLPGVHDALSSKIFAASGAQVLFLSGFGVSATKLGEPDAGILTLSEMESVARHVIGAVDKAAGTKATIPVIVDGDTGFGGPSNIRRTIRGLASAGAAAITIEDQVFPKRCTIAAGSGVRVVPREQSLERIKCALGARDEARDLNGNDVLIVARTDCRAALGLEEAIARCKAYEELGADVVYAENLQSKEEYVRLRSELRSDMPMMLAQVQQGSAKGASDNDDSVFDAQEIGDMGYSLALFGVTGLQSYVHALQQSAEGMLRPSASPAKSDGKGGGVLSGNDTELLCSFVTLKDIVGFPEVDDFESKYNVDL
eukprot:CAMPEP_0178478828 /NCGR_PEP_ID=MMETSP0696-20121128/4863_1 /TAXON_ID=265572 /ORGANISM="Extubocellulus spinifer, Strain CCMP396" /LENGTH=358 /DNA_ID=CAMNT_0020106213 /DNA_START=113 /DNA_END=1189 /DNA_ORIENTATION=-